MERLCNKHCGCNASSSRKRRSTDEYELSFFDILATMEREFRYFIFENGSSTNDNWFSETSSLTMARYRRETDEDDYLNTLEDLDSRISDVLTSLAAVPGKISALNESYDSFETSLDYLEETAEGKFFNFNRFQNLQVNLMLFV